MFSLTMYLNEIEDMSPGETIRLNHEDCEAGTDSRRRLYVTRTMADPSHVMAYCHNCQDSGHTNLGESYRISRHMSTGYPHPEQSVCNEITEPKGLLDQIRDWPTYAQAWAYSRRLAQVDTHKYGIKFDPSSDRVYLPRYEHIQMGGDKGELIGYQLRNVASHNKRQAKYLTVSKDGAHSWSFIQNGSGYERDANYCVLVEDLVSAIHIMRSVKGVLPDVFVMHGTKVDPVLMHNVAQMYDYATVWLDNDNDHVLKTAEVIRRTIAMYSDKINVCKVDQPYTDPKNYGPVQIDNILDEVWANG